MSETTQKESNGTVNDSKSSKGKQLSSFSFYTGKSLSEAFILTSTNPQFDKRLFTDLPVQYMKITSSEHVVYINCSEYQNKKQFVYTTCSELGIFMY